MGTEFYENYFSVDQSIELATYPDLMFGAVIDWTLSKPLPALLFSDWKHILKKWRNQVLNVKRILLVKL